MLTITALSHLDHDLTAGHLRFVLDHYRERDGFFIDTVELPETLPALSCALYGPAMGDAPVLRSAATLKPRQGRAWPSRMLCTSGVDLTRPQGDSGLTPRPTRLLTVIAGPHEGLACMLYTSYGGPAAPREPGDPSLQDEALAEAQAFWAVHALTR